MSSFSVITQDGALQQFTFSSKTEAVKLFNYFKKKELATVLVQDGIIVDKYVSASYQAAYLEAVNQFLAKQAPEPTHRWAFDESGGPAIDSVGGVSGELVNATRVQPGVSNSTSAVQFTGNSYVNFGKSVGQFGVSDFTVAMWINTTDGRFSDVLSNRIGGSYANFMWICVNHYTLGAGVVAGEVCQDGGGTNNLSLDSRSCGILVNDGQWHHITFSRSGNKLGLYIDGVSCTSSNSPTAPSVANINNGNDFRLGLANSDAGYGLNGRYDDFQMFDKVVIPTMFPSRVIAFRKA